MICLLHGRRDIPTPELDSPVSPTRTWSTTLGIKSTVPRENEVKQSRASKGSGRRFSQRGTPKTKSPRRQSAPREPEQGKKTSKRISDDTSCPIHPDASHTWGECFQNIRNANKRRKTSPQEGNQAGKGSKNPGQNKSNESTNLSTQYNINVKPADQEDTDETLSGLLNESCSGTSDANAFAIDSNYYSPHHLDSMSFDFPQLNKSLLEGMNTYASIADEIHDKGMYEAEIKNSSDYPLNQLNLRPVGVLLAKSIQNCNSNRPLHVLFDTGSDKSFIARTALPKNAAGKTVPALNINTINGVNKINQQVTLRNITLPEFSPTQTTCRICFQSLTI
mmetsp:Transcript_26605/g.37724  ORF Transcript_26605/g.37724 Transcript_26605/m.37724 type:complete len:335 (-) Transcript_26605:774-1778(-)